MSGEKKLLKFTAGVMAALAMNFAGVAFAQDAVGTSPWGPKDELGRMNLMTEESRASILSRVSGGKSYDLSVEYFIGMPGWHAAGDPRYQIWLTHSPRGNVVADPLGVGTDQNEHVSYTGTAVSMYSHTGTHIDALNHFGVDGDIYNHFSADKYLGDRGWKKTGAETIPVLIARGVLIDVAGAKGVDALDGNYKITRADLKDALKKQGTTLAEGDIILIRTGRMRDFEDYDAFMTDPPGMGLDAAKFLVEDNGAMVLGADNLSFEAFPSEVEGNYIPLHTYLLAQHGVPIMELVYLEDVAADGVYEFVFVGGSLKLRGADAAPMRPVAFPIN